MIVKLSMIIVINTLKLRQKIYNNRLNTDFHGKKVPKEDISYKWLSFKMLCSVIMIKRMYYPQALLEEFKCKTKKW